MLVKFYSEESAAFVMMNSSANQLLSIMGHGGSTEGAVSGEALDSALERLVKAVTNENDNLSKANSDNQSEAHDSDEQQEVALSARAAPLIAMLRRASDADGYVMWRPE